MKKLYMLCLGLMALAASIAQPSRPKMDSLMISASHYLNKLSKDYDPLRALELYKESAATGNAQAMYAVATQYRFGIGIKADPVQALAWFLRASHAGHQGAWAAIGLIYKDGDGVPIDYGKAYDYFAKGAAANDPQGIYGQGYMLYKGLGVAQDYAKAIALFEEGAGRGKSNCMYFLGLCFRNGFGVGANADSAAYWLGKATKRGYQPAQDELLSAEPENSGIAERLMDKIRAAQEAMAQGLTVNRYNKVENSVGEVGIEGEYSGYLMRYDYSGTHLLAVNKLELSLKYTKDSLQGKWMEDDSIVVPLKARLLPQALVFSQMSYWKKEHYSGPSGRHYAFQQARLQMIRKDSSLYLSGNVDLFDNDSKEPDKPVFIALVRTSGGKPDNGARLREEEELSGLSSLHAYPNPFSSTLTVNFELKEPARISTQLLTLDGKVIYNNNGGDLDPGTYSLPIQPGVIPAGVYIVKLRFGNDERTIKVIKL